MHSQILAHHAPVPQPHQLTDPLVVRVLANLYEAIAADNRGCLETLFAVMEDDDVARAALALTRVNPPDRSAVAEVLSRRVLGLDSPPPPPHRPAPSGWRVHP